MRLGSELFEKLVNKAYLQNKAMDLYEKENGLTPDSETATESRIRTIMFALQSAVQLGLDKESETVFQAIALLDMLHHSLNGKYVFINESKITPSDKEDVSSIFKEITRFMKKMKDSGQMPNLI